jgi:hypothetical protein
VKSHKSITASIIVAFTIAFAACGGGGNSPNPPAAIAVSFAAQPPTTLVIAATLSLTAVVNNDSAGAGVNWKVTCGSTQCGSFNPVSTGSSVATVYTAPAAIPTGNTVTLVATSISDSTKSVSASITITASATSVLPDGNYVFRLSGEDITLNGSSYFVAGAFTVLNKAIASGEQDFVDQGSGITDGILASGSSLSTTANGNIQIVLNTGDTNVGVNGVETLRGTLVSATHILISQFDGFAAATGTLDLQTGTAAPAGGYAFNLSGLDDSAEPLFIGGILNFTGTSVAVANSVFDFSDNGEVGQAQLFASGTVSAPDTFGRITISLTPSSTIVIPQFGLSGYIVGPNRIQLVEDVQDTLDGVLGGTALGQGANTGNFTQAGVGGSTYVFAAVGADATGVADLAGGFILNADGTVAGNLAVNDLNTIKGVAITGGNWTIGPGGRATLSNITPQILGAPLAFQLYLDGNGNALELGVDTSQGSAGSSFLQTTGAINPGSYAMGAQGFANVSGGPFWAANGPVAIDSGGNFTGTTDYNVVGFTPLPAVPLTGTTNTTTGVFTIAGLNSVSFSSTNAFGYFPIDNSRVLAIEVDSGQLGLFILEQTTP